MNIYLFIILLILASHYALDLMADLLNMRHIKEDLPPEFDGFYDAIRYRKSQNYLRTTTRFGILTNTISTIITIIFILAGGFNFADRIALWFEFRPIPTGLIFAGIIMIAGRLISLPFSVYETFVLEEKYGFNRTTPKTFINDFLKEIILIIVIGGALFSGILWFFGKTGTAAWAYCWIAVTVFQVFMIFISPYVIMPLFNKFTPMPEGALRTALEEYARSQNFTMKGVFRMDGSKRSSKSNAFFTGFGRSRRIVLFDTLIENHTVEELVSIVAHEMGHYKKKHILKAMIRSFIVSGLMFFMLSFFIENKGLFAAFKMTHLSVYASLFFFGFLFTPIGTLLAIVGNMISRKHEYEADAFAAKTTSNPQAMITALKKLAVTNLSNLTPHPFKVFIDYSHPPVLERIARISTSQKSG